MTVYKYFLVSFVRNKKIFILWFAIFAIMTFLMGGTSPQDIQRDFIKAKINIAISKNIDENTVNNIKEAVDVNQVIYIENSKQKAKEAVFLSRVDFALIENTDNKKLIAFLNPTSPSAYIAKSRLNSYFNFLEICKNEDNIALKISKINIKPNVIKERKKENFSKAWYHFTFKFLAYPLMAVVMSIIGLSIIAFENEKNVRRTKVSSKSNFKINFEAFLAQIIGTIVILIVVILIILAMAYLVFGGDSQIEYLAYLSNIFALSLSSLALIFLLCNINNNKTFISSIGSVLPLCLSFISGIFVDIEFLPSIATSIARFFPMFYYVKGNALAKNGFSSELCVYISIQILFALCFFLASVFVDRLKHSN